jgi:hypothetical protein
MSKTLGVLGPSDPDVALTCSRVYLDAESLVSSLG